MGETELERDIAQMARWWGLRKLRYLDRLADEFVGIVRPAAAFALNPDPRDIELMNAAMTEWFLFERRYGPAGTPLGEYLERPPRGVSEEARLRLAQVAETQFFSRFSIRDKDAERGIAVLEDTADARRYDVLDPHLVGVGHWREGVIAERIARVDGVWQMVGTVRLYDHAPAAATAPDGPGAVHPEDAHLAELWERAGPFLRLLRDTIGEDGRYRATARVRPLPHSVRPPSVAR
ncbi:MAG: hypothetical protein SOY67_03950 [Collinsella sp.]|nr:hypothetical protein [Collinsella sp.]